MTQNPFSFNYITLLQTSTYQSKKIDIKNAGFMRPAITFLNIQLSNSRENNMDFFGKIRYNMLHCEKAYMITREELTKNNGRK